MKARLLLGLLLLAVFKICGSEDFVVALPSTELGVVYLYLKPKQTFIDCLGSVPFEGTFLDKQGFTIVVDFLVASTGCNTALQGILLIGCSKIP